MNFYVNLSDDAKKTLKELKTTPFLLKRFKAVSNALVRLAGNPRHPSLQTHVYRSILGPNGEKVFEAYAENDTPGAYRILFYYGNERGRIDILMITPHP